MVDSSRSVTVTLGADEALDLVAANFERNPTAVGRICDGGWALERSSHSLLVRPNKDLDFLLDPLPDDFLAQLPETLAVRIEAAEVEGVQPLTQVTARVIRRGLGALAGRVGLDAVEIFAGLPLMHTLLHLRDMAVLRSNRRGAKVRLLRLALEPLIPHEHASVPGPFR